MIHLVAANKMQVTVMVCNCTVWYETNAATYHSRILISSVKEIPVSKFELFSNTDQLLCLTNGVSMYVCI